MKIDKSSLKQNTVLVVEDEEDIVKLIKLHLENEGYQVISAWSGTEALEKAFETVPDLILLDIMLPEMDGLEVCRRLRSSTVTGSIPIMILSARKAEFDKVLGLELGADDYLVKPFSVRELVARVRALLRRRSQHLTAPAEETGREEILKVGIITLYPERYQVFVNNKPLNLTHKEFLLLHLLMASAGKVVTRDLLLEKVWGYEVDIDTRTVDVHIRYLRQKVEEDPANPKYIETVRGVGYRFSVQPEQK